MDLREGTLGAKLRENRPAHLNSTLILVDREARKIDGLALPYIHTNGTIACQIRTAGRASRRVKRNDHDS